LSPRPPESTVGYLVLKIADVSNQELLHAIKTVLTAHKGPTDTFMILGSDTPKKIRLPFRVEISDGLLSELSAVVGEGQVSHAKSS